MADKKASGGNGKIVKDGVLGLTGAPARRPVPDDSCANPNYANYCRITGTPDELVLDFCLNANPRPEPVQELPVQDRVVMNFYMAKRLARALAAVVERHEETFGALETDVRKRAISRPVPERPPGQGTELPG